MDQYTYSMVARRGSWTRVSSWQCRANTQEEAEKIAMARCLEEFPLSQYKDYRVTLLKMEKNDA